MAENPAKLQSQLPNASGSWLSRLLKKILSLLRLNNKSQLNVAPKPATSQTQQAQQQQQTQQNQTQAQSRKESSLRKIIRRIFILTIRFFLRLLGAKPKPKVKPKPKPNLAMHDAHEEENLQNAQKPKLGLRATLIEVLLRALRNLQKNDQPQASNIASTAQQVLVQSSLNTIDPTTTPAASLAPTLTPAITPNPALQIQNQDQNQIQIQAQMSPPSPTSQSPTPAEPAFFNMRSALGLGLNAAQCVLQQQLQQQQQPGQTPNPGVSPQAQAAQASAPDDAAQKQPSLWQKLMNKAFSTALKKDL